MLHQEAFDVHNHNTEFEAFEAENLPNANSKKRMIEYLMEGFAPDEIGNYSGHLLGSGSRS